MNFRRAFRITLIASVAAGYVVAGPVATPTAAAAGPPIQAVTPARLVDTRTGQKTVDGQYAGIGVRTGRSSTVIKIAGRGGVPADASAVLLNLTDVQWLNPDRPLHDNVLSVYPCTSSRPHASSLNTPGGDIRANNVFVKLSPKGTVCVYSERLSNFIIDVQGFVPAGGSPIGVDPARLFDSRPGEKTVDGKQAGGGRLKADSRTQVQIGGRGGVPNDAAAAIINVTDVSPSGDNVLTAFASCELGPPNASSVNTPARDIRANNLYVNLDGNGATCVHTEQDTDLVVDVVGYVRAEGPDDVTPKIVTPHRLFDTRPDEPHYGQFSGGGGRVGARSTTEVQIAGRGQVPPEATHAIINLTSVLPSTGNLLIAYQCGTTLPSVSNVNSPANDIRANSSFVKLSATGSVCIYSEAPTDFLVDISGYDVVPPVPLRVAILECATPRTPISAVDYSFDYALNGKQVLDQQYAAVGGVPPYTYSASGLVGYTMNKDSGVLTRTTAANGTVKFTMNVSDAAGHQLTLPGSVTWEPTATVAFDYRAFLPNGQTVAGPAIVNWGKAPFTYSWSGLAGVKIDPATGALTYTTTSVPDPKIPSAITVTDQTGSRLVVKVFVEATNSSTIDVAPPKVIALGEVLSTFDTNGWGQAPYSFALSGAVGSSFAINSAGQLSITDPTLLQVLNQYQVQNSGRFVAELNVTVIDAAGQKMTVPLTVRVGRPPQIAFSC